MTEPAAAESLLTPSVVDGARRGDPDALVAVYRALSSSVYGYLLRQTRSPAWADDLTGDVFLEVVRSIARFEGTPEGLRAWIFRIAHNTLVDHYRRESRRRHQSIEDTWEAHEVAEPSGGPEAEAVSTVERERVIALVQSLPPDQRDVVLLRLVAELPLAAVAELLGKTVGAVKALQNRALRGLARRMGTDRDG